MNDAPPDRGTDAGIDSAANDEFCTTVVTAIADELGTDPTSLPPLHDSVDPDLLNRITDQRGSTTLSFEYLRYEVVVSSDGVVQVRPLA